MPEKTGRPNPERAKPRVAKGGGPLPTHVSYIFAESDGRYRLQIHQKGALRSRLGFHRELICADRAEYDALMAVLIAARVPFMVGHMMPGASDVAWFWLKEKGQPVDYLEISFGGRAAWQVREIREDAKEWRGVKLGELLGPEAERFDPFAPENRPKVERPMPPPEPVPPPAETQPPEAASPAAAEISPPPAAEAPPDTPPPAEPEPHPEPEPAPPPPPFAEAPPADPVHAAPKAPGLPGRRAVEYGWLLLLVALLGLSFWRATAYFGHVVPFEPASFFNAVALAALAFGIVYTAAWMTLFPRHFARWSQRLQLLALALLCGALIAFAELMIANIRHDDAPRIALQATVTGKTIFKGKNGRNPPEHWTWHLDVESWTTPGDERNLQVSRATWDEVEVGRSIVFHPHPGRLGWVWYARDELDAPGFVRVVQR